MADPTHSDAGGSDAENEPLSPVASLLAEALERAERDGAGAIEAACAEHPAHADELRRRFAALAELGLVQNPRSFGHYRVLRTLGRGGMGIVYLARDERMGRLVALKALPARFADNPRALARFQREIKAVAQLRHPGIVSIYAVDHDDGVPYFTMEHVEGRTLADIVAGVRSLGRPPEQLSADDFAPRGSAHSWVESACRVALDIALALQHSHAQGVVHRDVKPSNILVRPDGRALLFDFGLARLDDEPGLTLTGDFAGTPFYVSPEQVSARGGAPDGRTDVYSLGVTLYELLTLQRPFAGETSEQVFRQIETREPDLPRRANRAVPHDLQTICLTALEKDPARRYQAAGDMADDLRALLEFRPVRARPVGRVRRVSRFVRRNPALASAVLLGALLLVGTPVGLAVANLAIRKESQFAQSETERAERALERVQEEASRAQAEADRATDEAEKARLALVRSLDRKAKADRALEFLLSVLTSVDPLRDDRDVPMVDVLRRAAEELGPALTNEPFMAGMVRQNIGLTFRNLGLYAEAEAQFRSAIEAAEPADAPDRDYLTALALNDLALVLARTGRLREAQATMLQALELRARVPALAGAQGTQFLHNAALIRMLDGDGIGARVGFEEVLARHAAELPEGHPLVVQALLNVAANTPDHAAAEAMNRRALQLQERTLAPDDPQIALTLGNLAIGRFQQGDAAEAELLALRALGMLRERLGSQHVQVLDAQVVLGIVRGHLGRHEEAAALLEAALSGFRSVFPDGHPRVVTVMRQLAEEWHALGRDTEGVPLLRDALAMQTRLDATDDKALEECRSALRAALLRLGRSAEAEALPPGGS